MKLKFLSNIVVVVLLQACGSSPEVKVPEWVGQYEPDLISRQQISGAWVLNTEFSDDIAEALSYMHKPDREQEYVDRLLGRPKKAKPGISGLQEKVMADSRLIAAYAKEIVVKSDSQKLIFIFDQQKASDYLLNGEPLSLDGNINITLSAWEAGKFIVEKNGPGGRLLEQWTLSPDGAQLHLRVQYEPPMLLQPLVLNRLFDRDVGLSGKTLSQ